MMNKREMRQTANHLLICAAESATNWMPRELQGDEEGQEKFARILFEQLSKMRRVFTP